MASQQPAEKFCRARPRAAATAWTVLVLTCQAGAAETPTVASINLCSDQLVLSLADPEQILSVSWLAADPEESMYAELADKHVLNYGSAEELLRLDPDVIVAGIYTNAFTRALMRELGFKVVDVVPANDLEDIARNLRQVGDAIAQRARAEGRIRSMRDRSAAIAARAPRRPLDAVVVRPGGFTAGRPSLADHLMQLAGLRNVAADQGLDRWGSLSMETLLASRPELIVLLDYRSGEPSIANAALRHPALRRSRAGTRPVTMPSRYWGCGLPESLDSADRLVEFVRDTRLATNNGL
jgi:iron complex transport system substrate-binding protein